MSPNQHLSVLIFRKRPADVCLGNQYRHMPVHNYLNYIVYPGVGLGTEKEKTNHPGVIMQDECVVGCIVCDLT